MPELDKTYFQTGKVRFIFRDFPLASIHKSAVRAAHAARCAGDQGRYWQMHDTLYASQDTFQPDHNADFATFRGLAGDIGLDVDQFMSCMESRKYLDQIARETSDGGALGVRATPSYLLDGELVVGLFPTVAWKQMLDQALARHGVAAAP